MFGLSPTELIVILLIALVIFGGTRLRSLGGDLGAAIKGFRKAVKDEGKNKDGSDDKPDSNAGS